MQESESQILAVPVELLRCPETRQRLAPATPELVALLEFQRLAGTLRFQADHPQFNSADAIEAALLREDGLVCYPVQKGVPLLLPGYGIAAV